ncbi:MAG: NAD(P)H-hydrate dehydratase [Candidatus Thermoplasmatota archaeon]|nr:NAD(P)H-hydrate dehydratase [Candidatus Thermoplasmatota archaeon]MBS3789840.1 NAD(P)H-hydrate dehydratase [Candidatus Thermoplasmatota archaeon]
MLSYKEVPVMDKNSEYRGVPPEELMENAGRRLAEAITKKFSERPVLFICGTGNNGGDAYVAARYLTKEWDKTKVKIYLVRGEEDIRSDIARKNFEQLDCKIKDEIIWSEIGRKTILVDALLGTGVKGKIRQPYRGIIENINEVENPVISVDVPSGLGSDMSVRPDLTVTFQDKKEGMSVENSGEIEVVDIGVPKEALTHTGPGEMLLYPKSKEDSHKGENGELLIVGGGPYTGAPTLAAMAAYRTGVDLVHLMVPASISEVVSGYSPNFLVHPLEGEHLVENHIDKILKLSRECDSIIIGPGLGEDKRTLDTVSKLVGELDIPMLIDADGLKAIRDGKTEFSPNVVLTPHRQEFEMLADDKEKDRELQRRADDFAKRNSVVLVVKGKVDYITDGERYRWNDFGNEGMTVGGTGDTLSGVIGGLMSKRLEPFNSARLGTYMTCRAGDIAFEELRWGLTPVDITKRIPKTFKDQ